MHSCFSKIFIYLSRNYNVWGNYSVEMLAALLIFQSYAFGFGWTELTSQSHVLKVMLTPDAGHKMRVLYLKHNEGLLTNVRKKGLKCCVE